MSELDANVVIDGQRAIATVAQTGTVIQDGGAVDATCVIQTDDGPQKAVKTYDLNGGGGGGTVDQTYDATSTNAQSGTAVAEAVAPALKNTATGTNSLTIQGQSATAGDSVNIGSESVCQGFSNNYPCCVSIGRKANASASTYTGGSVAIGAWANASNGSIAIGSKSNQYGGYPYANARGAIAIGNGAYNAQTKAEMAKSIAIGEGANAGGEAAIQFGTGTNSTANTFQVYSYPMLDGTTGKIPMARLPIVQISQADYDALVSGGTVDANTLYLIV